MKGSLIKAPTSPPKFSSYRYLFRWQLALLATQTLAKLKALNTSLPIRPNQKVLYRQLVLRPFSVAELSVSPEASGHLRSSINNQSKKCRNGIVPHGRGSRYGHNRSPNRDSTVISSVGELLSPMVLLPTVGESANGAKWAKLTSNLGVTLFRPRRSSFYLVTGLALTRPVEPRGASRA